MHSICYISNKKEDVDSNGLHEVFDITQKNNEAHNITGILLYLEGSFLQVIEGDKMKIATLFERIKADNRHHNIFVIIDKSIDKRVFKNYKSGFTLIKTKEDLEDLNTYLNSSQEHKNVSNNIQEILKPFLL